MDEIAATPDLSQPRIPEAWVGKQVLITFDGEPRRQHILLAVRREGIVVDGEPWNRFTPWQFVRAVERQEPQR